MNFLIIDYVTYNHEFQDIKCQEYEKETILVFSLNLQSLLIFYLVLEDSFMLILLTFNILGFADTCETFYF